MISRRENFRYDASGLSGVTLKNVRVSRCQACGEWSVAIPRIDELHTAIAHAVVSKRTLLVPEEIRFLRKYLGWSGSDFAAHMGTTPESVSRWENGRLAMSLPADRALRLMVAVREPIQDYELDRLRAITSRRTTRPLRVGLSLAKSGWTSKAA